MTTMIERVARAIYVKVPYGYGMTGAETLEYARAAIEAMREPTEAMRDGGNSLGHDEAPATYYTAMIDTALEEGK